MFYVVLFFRETYFIMIFFFRKLVVCFLLRETWCMPIFVHETCSMWIISSRNLLYLDLCHWKNLLYFYFFFMRLFACWSFSLWKLYSDFFSRETGFVLGNCCVLIFVRETWFILMFSFVKHVLRFFILSWSLIYHDIFLRETYCMLGFSSWNMMHADFVRET